LALLALLAVLYALVFLPGERHKPKLGLDLIGGQQVIFQARAPHGQTPSSSAMQQAKQIMEDRVNGTGVTESTVVIQGSDQIVISIPGGTAQDVQRLGAAAVLNFRGAVAPATPVTCGQTAPAASGSSTPSPSGSTTPSGGSTSPAGGSSSSHGTRDVAERRLTAPTPTPSSTPSPSASGSSSAAAPSACTLTSVAQLKKLVKLPDPSTVYQSKGLSDALAQQVAAQLTKYDCSRSQDAPDPRNDYYLACDTSGLAYLLGPVVVPGSQIDNASAIAPNASGGSLQWSVQLTLKSSGSSAWAKYTGAHNVNGSNSAPAVAQCSQAGTPCADYVGFTLDGKVISAPVNLNAINGQATQITGNFDQKTATALARELKYGALPLSFNFLTSESVSATLGSSQLKAGLLAGGIGLALVILYSLIYYRALGIVTIASLCVSGGLTWAMLVILGREMGFTLSLAGIAGFIVAVGITADSFVVFFERIKDEVHEGRSVRVAVPRAWVRARRTILSADTVSFLAAAILYYFAAGDVKGFAFTLGLSTILDLVVVFLFTHPMISLLSRSRAFGSARFTGLNSVRVGGIAISDEPPPPRRSRAQRAARAASGEDEHTSAVAVLEKPAERTAEPPPDEPEPEALGERRRTTPEPGSAAERAAARRARMREEAERKGRKR
jgi:preprotein translocase subunit SecD